MYRQKNNIDDGMKSASCPKCKSKRLMLKGSKLICTNCDFVIGASGNEYGAKRALNTDYSKERVCMQCGNKYFKDKRVNNNLWSKTKYCSPMCQRKASTKYASRKDKSTAWRRRNGVLAIGSAELSAKLSEQTKIAMQRTEVQEKIRAPRSSLTLEHRMKVSDSLAGKMPSNLYVNNNQYSNIKRGYYDINGDTIFFRSSWEANYALYLDWLIDQKQIYKWEFEPDTFMFEAIKLGTRSYTPDFKVFTNETDFEYHEVKGYMDSKSKTKLKRFAKYYPEHKLLLVDSSSYLLIKKQIGKLLKFY